MLIEPRRADSTIGPYLKATAEGLSDEFQLSKLYKKKYGVSPKYGRKN